MPDFALVPQALLIGAVASAAVMLLANRYLPSPTNQAGWAWAVGAGIYAASGLVDQWPHWPALEDRARFLTLLVPLTLAVETIAATFVSSRAAWLLRLGLAAAAAPILLHNSVYLVDHNDLQPAAWSPLQMSLILSLLAAMLAGMWCALSRLQARTSAGTIEGLLLIDALAAAVTVMLSGYYRGGLLGMALAGSIAGVLCGSLAGRRAPGADESLGMSVLGIFSIVLIGRFFGALPTGSAICLLAAPLLGWTAELPGVRRRPTIWRTFIRLASVALLLSLVVFYAYWKFTQASGPRRMGISL